MKKQHLLFAILMSVLLFSSCSKNEDNNNSSALIGIWSPLMDVSVCSSGSEEIYEYDACEKKELLNSIKMVVSSSRSMNRKIMEIACFL